MDGEKLGFQFGFEGVLEGAHMSDVKGSEFHN